MEKEKEKEKEKNKINYDLSTNELKYLSKFFLKQYMDCGEVRDRLNMYYEKDPCMFLYREYIKYDKEYIKKTKN
jgi:hypothetical protein